MSGRAIGSPLAHRLQDLVRTCWISFVRNGIQLRRMDAVPLRRKTGTGCMGCLTKVLVTLALGVVLIFAVDAVLVPWSFYMGGNFHLVPMWQGWGRMHAKAGDYLLFVQMEPRIGRYMGVAHLGGTGLLCTPRGETFKLTLGADFDKHIRSTDGEHVDMYLHKRPGAFLRSSGDTRPRFNFRGAWHNPDIVLDDHGSLSREFRDDGTLYPTNRSEPTAHGVLSLILKEGKRSDFEAACKAGTTR